MGTNIDLTVRKGENERQYIWRLHYYVAEGKMTWEQLAEAVNANWRKDESEYRTESAYRKPCQAADVYYAEVFADMVDKQYGSEIADQKREIEMAKIQMRDERRAWQEQNAVAARVMQKLDYMEDILKDIGRCEFPVFDVPLPYGTKRTMIVCLSDLHIGETFDTAFGRYDSDIARVRLADYLSEIKEIAKRHEVDRCVVASLGDQISGSIHKRIAVTNRENVIEQVKLSAELIASFCAELCGVFNEVEMCSAAGNHSRIDRKEDALHDERLDDLISWIVGKILKDVPNFRLLTNHYGCNIGEIEIDGVHYVAVHGDFDSASKSGMAKLSQMLGYFPNYVLCGHLHENCFIGTHPTQVIQSGTLAGCGDDYTIEHRLCGKPSQMVAVCDESGVRCLYPVTL